MVCRARGNSRTRVTFKKQSMDLRGNDDQQLGVMSNSTRHPTQIHHILLIDKLAIYLSDVDFLLSLFGNR